MGRCLILAGAATEREVGWTAKWVDSCGVCLSSRSRFGLLMGFFTRRGVGTCVCRLVLDW